MNRLVFCVTAIVCTFLCVLTIMPVMADAAGDVASLMNKVHKGEEVDISAVEAAPPEQVLAEVPKYLNNSDKSVRMEAVRRISSIATYSPNRDTRKKGMRLLFDVATSHSDPRIAGYAAEGLLNFSRADFAPEMQGAIYRHLMSHKDAGEVNPKAILLAGIAGVKASAGRLREFASSSSKGMRWIAQLALARMDDQAAIQVVVTAAKNETDSTKRLESLHDLAFIRQPEAVGVMVTYLFSDEETPKSDSDAPSTKYAHTAIDYLAEIIENFPPKSGPYMDAYVDTARQWIIEQGGTAKLKIKR